MILAVLLSNRFSTNVTSYMVLCVANMVTILLIACTLLEITFDGENLILIFLECMSSIIIYILKIYRLRW